MQGNFNLLFFKIFDSCLGLSVIYVICICIKHRIMLYIYIHSIYCIHICFTFFFYRLCIHWYRYYISAVGASCFVFKVCATICAEQVRQLCWWCWKWRVGSMITLMKGGEERKIRGWVGLIQVGPHIVFNKVTACVPEKWTALCFI